jgi:hypothetical protein
VNPVRDVMTNIVDETCPERSERTLKNERMKMYYAVIAIVIKVVHIRWYEC